MVASSSTTAVAAKSTESKAKVVAKTLKEGAHIHRHKIRTSTRFTNEKVPRKPSASRVPKRILARDSTLDEFSIIKSPLTTEAALKQVEQNNTIVFLCNIRATKPEIKAAVQKRFGVKPMKVNTLIRPDGQKKAFVRLQKGDDALDVASRIGML